MIIKGLPDILKDEPKLSECIIEYTGGVVRTIN